jgi:hypothetical protein
MVSQPETKGRAMIINIDTDYIVSLYNCDFDTAATVLAILNDNEDNLLDKVDDAIIHIVGDNSCWDIRVKVNDA